MTPQNAHRKFIDRIGLYNGFLFQTETHFYDIIRSQNRILEKTKSAKFAHLYMGSKLIYRNPISINYEFAYHYSVDEKNINATLENLKKHYFNFIIAQCFEAFATFLKDITAAYFFINSNNTKINFPINTSSYETCRYDISYFCRSKNKYNKKLFDLIYKINPEISEIENKNTLHFNFKQWNVVFTEIRHSIIHSNSQFDLECTTNWSDFQKKILNQLFLEKTENEIGYISTVTEYKYIIKIIAQHGQIIIDSLKEKTK